MFRQLGILILWLCFSANLYAQTPADSTQKNPWRMAGSVNLSTMQSAYSDNWDSS